MDRSADEAAIRQLFHAMSDVWERGDMRTLDEIYTPDADYVTFDGSWLRGVEENRKVHAGLFSGLLAGACLRGEVESIRFVAPDTAVVISTGGVVWPWHKEIPASRRSRQTTVLVRSDGRWKVASFQNTRVRPMPSPDSFFMKVLAALLRFRLARWRRRHPAALAPAR
jgi:uncharacterized protein (TIGR02246 family)